MQLLYYLEISFLCHSLRYKVAPRFQSGVNSLRAYLLISASGRSIAKWSASSASTVTIVSDCPFPPQTPFFDAFWTLSNALVHIKSLCWVTFGYIRARVNAVGTNYQLTCLACVFSSTQLLCALSRHMVRSCGPLISFYVRFCGFQRAFIMQEWMRITSSASFSARHEVNFKWWIHWIAAIHWFDSLKSLALTHLSFCSERSGWKLKDAAKRLLQSLASPHAIRHITRDNSEFCVCRDIAFRLHLIPRNEVNILPLLFS